MASCQVWKVKKGGKGKPANQQVLQEMEECTQGMNAVARTGNGEGGV